MKERLIRPGLERALRGGAILGLVAFSLGCEQKIREKVGRNDLISLSSECEGSEPVVKVRVRIPKPGKGSEINLLVIKRGPRDSRVLGVVTQDNPLEQESREYIRRFKRVYKPDGLYNVGVPDFQVEGGENITMAVHSADLFIENNRRIPRFKEQLDEVTDKVAVCSGPKKS